MRGTHTDSHDSISIQNLGLSELPAIVRVHLTAFPESVLAKLGSETVRRYYEWQLTGPHDAVALGAFVNTELVGFCFGGIFRGAMAGFLRKNRGYLAFCVLMRPWLVANPGFRKYLMSRAHVLKPLVRFTRSDLSVTHPKAQTVDSFAILSIAMHPRHQGKGIGKCLMQEAESIAHKRGFLQMHLTVQPDNYPAIHFYERCDWERFSKDGVWSGHMRKTLMP